MHSIARAFTIGREEIIQDLFIKIVYELNEKHPGQLKNLQYYLIRHIQIDEEKLTCFLVETISFDLK